MRASELTMFKGDVDDAWLKHALGTSSVAWDIETTGLDWRVSRIATCQVAADGEIAVVQLEDGHTPSKLASLLSEKNVKKVFHHAPFDLRFMTSSWQVPARNVACTKIAAKIIDPNLEASEYSLKPVLKRFLGINIDKGQQVSDWLRTSLSMGQIEYAANDVRYLIDLFDAQCARAKTLGAVGLITASYEYLPRRVQLDLVGVGDVFAY
jgi:ribonuclease D